MHVKHSSLEVEEDLEELCWMHKCTLKVERDWTYWRNRPNERASSFKAYCNWNFERKQVPKLRQHHTGSCASLQSHNWKGWGSNLPSISCRHNSFIDLHSRQMLGLYLPAGCRFLLEIGFLY